MNVMLSVFNSQAANIKGLAESNSAMKFSSESNTIIVCYSPYSHQWRKLIRKIRYPLSQCYKQYVSSNIINVQSYEFISFSLNYQNSIIISQDLIKRFPSRERTQLWISQTMTFQWGYLSLIHFLVQQEQVISIHQPCNISPATRKEGKKTAVSTLAFQLGSLESRSVIFFLSFCNLLGSTKGCCQ